MSDTNEQLKYEEEKYHYEESLREASAAVPCFTHHHACECRERAMLEILVLVEPIMEAWAKSHELEEWHRRVEDLIGTAYPSFIYLPNTPTQPTP